MRRSLRSRPSGGRCSTDRSHKCALLLAASHQGNEVVACACEYAQSAGVRTGMTVTHARSLLIGRTLFIERYQPEEDAKALKSLARWAVRFTPVVAVDEPDGLLMDISGCAHLYGGEAMLADRVAGSLEGLGFKARIAVAPTFVSAQVVSRSAEQQITIVEAGGIHDALASLPIAALRMDTSMGEALREIGIERIGQLFDLPRAELAARFSGNIGRCLDRATGDALDAIEPVQPLEPIEVERVFDGPVTSLEAILISVRELLRLLLRRLEKESSGACELSLTAERIHADPVMLALRLSHPSRDEAHLWSLLQPRLERLSLGYGVEEIRLRAVHTQRTGNGQMEFWPDPSSSIRPEQSVSWGQMLDQLTERIGREGVTVAAPSESYVPERAFVFQPWDEDRASRNSRSTEKASVYAAARPSRLFAPPDPVRVVTLTPDGPLLRLEWGGRAGAVRSCLGPERLVLPWWADSRRRENESAAMPGGSATRDYYTVQDEHGRWLWVFRDGASGRWFVHGEWT